MKTPEPGALPSYAPGPAASEAPELKWWHVRRPRLPRFSLRSLLVFMFLLASSCLLWLHWAPWVPLAWMEESGPFAERSRLVFLDGGSRLAAERYGEAAVWDAGSGALRHKYALRTHNSSLRAFAVTDFGLRKAWAGTGIQPAALPALEQPEKPDNRLEFPVETATGNRPLGEVLKELAALLPRHGVTDLRIEREDPPPAPLEVAVTPGPAPISVRVPVTPFDGDGEPMKHEVQGFPWALAFEMAALQANFAVRYEQDRVLLRPREAWNEYVQREEDAAVHVQDLDRGVLAYTVRGSCPSVSNVAFACDGRLLVVHGLGGELTVLRTEDGSVGFDMPRGSVWNSGPCSFSDGGRRMATRSYDGKAVCVVTVGDPAAHRSIQSQAEVESVALSPDGTRLLVGEYGQAMHLYGLDPFRELASWREMSGNVTSTLRDYRWTPGGARLLSLEFGGANVVRDANGVKEPLPPHASAMRSTRTPQVAADNRRVLCRDRDDPNRYAIWDLETFEPLLDLPPYARNPDFERLFGWAQDLLGLERAPVHPPAPPPVLANPFAAAPVECFAPFGDPRFAPGGERVAASWSNAGLCVWQRRRPEWWWGVAWLPEFWLAAAFALALAWSLRRDWKALRAVKR